MYNFDAKEATEGCIEWIREYAKNNNMHKVVIGISGGKDSYIAAALCCKALGKENVIGIMMPNGEQKDISDSVDVCMDLDIEHYTVNIYDAYHGILGEVLACGVGASAEAKINIAPRLRMTTLYTIGQTLHARVCGTGNLSEITLGYCTKYGDMASDFNPLANFTSVEVVQIGDYLGLKHHLVHKTPADGITGSSDEQNMGITYLDTHNYIRGLSVSDKAIEKIKAREIMSMHKRNKIPSYNYFA